MSVEAESMGQTPVLVVSDAAQVLVREARQGERNPSDLALYIEINGEADGVYTYDMWFEATQNASPSDVTQHFGDLSLVVVGASVAKMLGATLDVGDAGLVMVNPNTPPKPKGVAAPTSDLSSPLELAVLEVLKNEVNPQIASHGGRADLVAVDEDNIAYLRLSGGCQGCGLAAVTLSQGIAVAIKEAVPEIADIVDITSHGDGTNPYFEGAKK